MNESRLFTRSRHNRFLLSLLSFERGENMCIFLDAIFLDANPIRVAPKCHDTGGLACLYHGTFADVHTF
jgi:hypothetical protein